MDLVKAGKSPEPASGIEDGSITLNERELVLSGVATTVAAFEEVERTARAFGTLEVAEPGKTLISARFNGRIEHLHVDAVGKRVKAGAPLFDIYSPDIVQAANEYLQALRSGAQDGPNLEVIRSKLALMGITDAQIREMATGGSVPLVIPYLSPASGTVMEKRIISGSYVSEGAPLYEIADLTTLWNIADVFESDAREVSVGDRVTLTTAAYPGKEFRGKVALLYPVVDAATRTIKARVVVANPTGELRPNMYTETVFRGPKVRMLTVPASAVLVTGKRNLVYVKVGPGNTFEAREVRLAGKYDLKYGIASGLSEGEEVVLDGGYLIDSESQLKIGGGTAHQHSGSEETAPAGQAPGTHNH